MSLMKDLYFTMTSPENDAVDTQHTQQRQDTRQIMTDDKMITAEQFRDKLGENKLSPQPHEDLYNVLIKYQ